MLCVFYENTLEKMDEQLLIRFLTHRCSPEEMEQVSRWASSDKANGQWLFEMERIWSLKDELLFSDQKEIETAYNEFLAKINPPQKTAPKNYYLRFMKYAAAIVVIALLAGNLYRTYNKTDDTLAESTVEVPIGQRVSLILSDGTKVWLNSQSKFTYPVDFKTQNRNVRLEGEGYFEVAHNPKSPFVVETSSMRIRVLGTKFNLKTYDGVSSVTLAEGKVQVNVDEIEKEVVLRPHEQAVYRNGKEELTVVPADTDNEMSWVEGVILFDDEPMNEVLKKLSRHYNVMFEVKDTSVNSQTLTMRITDEPLEQALEYIRLATGITYKIEKTTPSEKGKTATYHVTLTKQ